MTEYMRKRIKLLAYFLLEALAGVVLVYLFWLMLDAPGVIIGSVTCIGIVKKVDKMLK